MQEIQNQTKGQVCFPIQQSSNANNQLRLGTFVFKPGISEHQIQDLISEKGIKLACASAAYRYSKKQMVNVRVWLKFCTQWDHGVLQLGSHGFSRFFNDFQNIALNNLLVLNLQNNNINSIELIQSLEAPNLDCIYLHGNPIVAVKSLRKTNFPKLTRLYINISDNEHYSQLNCKNLSLIQNSPRTPKQKFEWKKYNSIRWIAKMEFNKLRRVVRGIQKYVPNFDRKALDVLNQRLQIT